MKINKLIIALLSFAAMFASCAPEDLDRHYAEVQAEPSYIVLDKAGDTAQVVVTTTGPWNITNIPEWLDVKPTSGEAAPDGVTITLIAKKAYEALSAEIYVNVGTVSQTIYVTQPFGELAPTKIQDVIDNGVDGRTYLVQGIVNNIVNTLYGNYYIKDESVAEGNGLYIYGMLDAAGATKNFLSLGIEEGDEILISGPRKNYGGTIELVDASLVKIINKALLGADVKSFVVADTAGVLSVPVIVKGDDVSVKVKDGAEWMSFKGIETPGQVLIEYQANPADTARTGSFVVSSSKDGSTSELTFTVKQTPKAPAAKKVTEIDYTNEEYVSVEGIVVALATSGFVLEDQAGRVFVEASDAECALGDSAIVLGAASVSNAMNKVTADLFTTKKAEAEYEAPEAVVLDSLNAADVIAESPAKYGYYSVTGFLGSNKSLYIPGTDYAVTAIDAISDIDFKKFSGKYVTATFYNADADASKGQIKGIWTSLVAAEDAPKYIKLPYTSDELEWNETEASISIVSTIPWTASIMDDFEGASIDKESGSGNATINFEFEAINNTYEDEEVKVLILAEGQDSLFYTVTRTGKVLKLSGPAKIFPEAQEVILSIEASKFWRVEMESEYATLDKTEGYMTDAIVVSIDSNDTNFDREIKVTIYEDRVEGEAYKYEHIITQLSPATAIYPTVAALTEVVMSGATEYDVEIENAVVTYINGKNAFIEDATGGILLYKSEHGLKEGQLINGKIKGTCEIYNGFAELKDIDLTEATVTDGAEIPCTEITIVDLLANYDRWINCKVIIKGVEVTDGVNLGTDRKGVISQDGATINLYSQDKNSVILETGSMGDLICFPTRYNETKQVGMWQNDHFTPAN